MSKLEAENTWSEIFKISAVGITEILILPIQIALNVQFVTSNKKQLLSSSQHGFPNCSSVRMFATPLIQN